MNHMLNTDQEKLHLGCMSAYILARITHMVIVSIVAWPAGSRSSLMQPMKSLDLNCRLGSPDVSIHRSVDTAGLGPHAVGKLLSQLPDGISA